MADSFPIRELSSTFSKWVIMARVSQKSELKTFQRKNSPDSGAVFSATLIDKDDDQIKAQFWNAAAQSHYETLQEGKVYTFSNGAIKVSNKKFNNTPHPYEIHFDGAATIKQVADDRRISLIKFDFTPIRDIKNKVGGSPGVVDIMAIVQAFKPIEQISFTKNGQQQSLQKRQLTLVDDSEYVIEVALMGNAAEVDEEKLSGNPVIGLKEILIKEYQGNLSGSSTRNSRFDYDPQEPRAAELRGWFSNAGKSAHFNSITGSGNGSGSSGKGSSGTVTKETDLEGLMLDEDEVAVSETRYYKIFGRVSQVRRESQRKEGGTKELVLYYMACPNCRKKTNSDDGSHRCFSCNKDVDAVPRFIFPITIQDAKGSAVVTVGHEVAEKILKLSAKDYKALEGSNDKNSIDKVVGSLGNALFQEFAMVIRYRPEVYEGILRPKAFLHSATPIDYYSETQKLMKEVLQKIGSFQLHPSFGKKAVNTATKRENEDKMKPETSPQKVQKTGSEHSPSFKTEEE